MVHALHYDAVVLQRITAGHSNIFLPFQVETLLAEYLKQCEAEALVPLWLKALTKAASDYQENRNFEFEKKNSNGHMHGKRRKSSKNIDSGLR